MRARLLNICELERQPRPVCGGVEEEQVVGLSHRMLVRTRRYLRSIVGRDSDSLRYAKHFLFQGGPPDTGSRVCAQELGGSRESLLPRAGCCLHRAIEAQCESEHAKKTSPSMKIGKISPGLPAEGCCRGVVLGVGHDRET